MILHVKYKHILNIFGIVQTVMVGRLSYFKAVQIERFHCI